MTWFDKNPEENIQKQTIYEWFSQAWDSVTPLNIIKAFLTSGISNELDGSTDFFSENLIKLRDRDKELNLNLEEAKNLFF